MFGQRSGYDVGQEYVESMHCRPSNVQTSSMLYGVVVGGELRSENFLSSAAQIRFKLGGLCSSHTST
jgi:hypothetical protein